MISLQCLHVDRVEDNIIIDTKTSDLVELTDPMFVFQKVRFVHGHFVFGVSAQDLQLKLKANVIGCN